MSVIKKVGKNFLSLLGGQIISNIISFFEIIYLARVLSPEYFGKISFAQVIVGYFLIFTDFGLTRIGTKEIARDASAKDKIVSGILSFRLVLSFLFYILLLLLTFLIKKPAIDKYLIMFFGLSLFPFILSTDWFFQAREKMEFSALYNILKSAVAFFLIISFVRTIRQVLLVPVFYIAGFLVAGVVLLGAFWKAGGKIYFFWDRDFLKSLLHQSLPVGFSVLMMEIYYRIDSVMLGLMRTDAEVGYYNASYRLIFALGALAGLFYQTLFPLASRYYLDSKEKLSRLVNYSSKFMISLAIPVGVGGFLLAGKLIAFIYGKDYLPYSAQAFQILIWSTVITFLSYGFSLFLIAADLGKEYARSVFWGAIFNAVTNFIFIPRLGIAGAALTTVATEILIFGWMLYYFNRKVFKFSLIGFLPKPILASLIMGAVVYFLPGNFFLGVIAGIIVYGLVFILLKGFTADEWRILRGLR